MITAGSAILLGSLYGFIQIVGPDHLGTLLTLGIALGHWQAFKVGFAWGLGHTLGMMVVCALFVFTHQLTSFNFEAWGHHGGYLIGASMVFCALYFIVRESTFLEEKDDGSTVQVPCWCHGGQRELQNRPPPGVRHTRRQDGAISADTCSSCEDFPDDPFLVNSVRTLPKRSSGFAFTRPQTAEKMPLLQRSSGGFSSKEACEQKTIGGAIIGLLQGMACPMGIVGLGFLLDMTAVPEVVLFLISFMLVSVLGSGLITMGCAALTNCGVRSLSAKLVYRSSCCFTLILGACWIVMNYLGMLTALDYGERLEGHVGNATVQALSQ